MEKPIELYHPQQQVEEQKKANIQIDSPRQVTTEVEENK